MGTAKTKGCIVPTKRQTTSPQKWIQALIEMEQDTDDDIIHSTEKMFQPLQEECPTSWESVLSISSDLSALIVCMEDVSGEDWEVVSNVDSVQSLEAAEPMALTPSSSSSSSKAEHDDTTRKAVVPDLAPSDYKAKLLRHTTRKASVLSSSTNYRSKLRRRKQKKKE